MDWTLCKHQWQHQWQRVFLPWMLLWAKLALPVLPREWPDIWIGETGEIRERIWWIGQTGWFLSWGVRRWLPLCFISRPSWSRYLSDCPDVVYPVGWKWGIRRVNWGSPCRKRVKSGSISVWRWEGVCVWVGVRWIWVSVTAVAWESVFRNRCWRVIGAAFIASDRVLCTIMTFILCLVHLNSFF